MIVWPHSVLAGVWLPAPARELLKIFPQCHALPQFHTKDVSQRCYGTPAAVLMWPLGTAPRPSTLRLQACLAPVPVFFLLSSDWPSSCACLQYPSARCPRTPPHPRASNDDQHCTGNHSRTSARMKRVFRFRGRRRQDPKSEKQCVSPTSAAGQTAPIRHRGRSAGFGVGLFGAPARGQALDIGLA